MEPGIAPLTQPLAQCFGTGAPGWLSRDMPPGTSIDLEHGRAIGPFGVFVRSPASKQWARTAQ